MHALQPVIWRIQIFNRQFPIANLAVMDDIGDLCKQDLKGPQVLLVACVRRDVRRFEIMLQRFLLVMPSR